MCSSESFADQGYAASEGMADSPSASPEDTVSLCPDPSPCPCQPQEDSDDDEGCATWGSRYSTGGVRAQHQTVKKWNGYEDPEITAQIHRTLANLDADLVNAANQSELASLHINDEIPVSVVDLDIPVTSIDDVPDYHSSGYEVTLQHSNLKKQDRSNKLTVELQNQNNNATRVAHADQYQAHKCSKKEMENIAASSWIKSASQTERRQSPAMSHNPVAFASKTVPNSNMLPLKTVPLGPPQYQSKITQNPMSRFGLKTFTIVPPKPAMSQTPKPAGSLRTGAIKIDEFGNMVKQRGVQESGFPSEVNNDLHSPLLGKAKAFWNSAQKQDLPPDLNKRAPVKTREPEQLKSEITATSLEKSLQQTKQVSGSVTNLSFVRTREAEILHSEIPVQKEHLTVQEPLKQFGGSTPNLASAVMKKLAVADPAESVFFSEHRKNFLVPTRRTSSQYVASAVAKYSGNTSTTVLDVPESTSGSQKQVSNQGCLAVSATSVPKTNNHVKSSYIKSATSSFKTLPAPTSSVPYNTGPKRSQSYTSHIAEKVEVLEEPPKEFTSTSIKSLSSSHVNTNTQVHTHLLPKFTQHPSKDSTRANKALENTSPLQSPTDTRPSVSKKPEVPTPLSQSEPNQTGLFGPVKKFKPVIPKTVEDETSLHSSLMEAIQSGRGTQRLRKVPDSSRSSTLTKPTYVEPENERCALLSAIRAHHSTRLNKTRSEAAVELDRCRKADDDRAVEKEIVFIPPPGPPSFAPPPPPPPPAFIPPPPPLNVTSTKPAVVLPAGGNPEFAREALLEAIRSGSGAKQLRKVPVTMKTMTVNGRLGTFKAPSPHPQEQ